MVHTIMMMLNMNLILSKKNKKRRHNFFDDVTEDHFDGIVRLIDEIKITVSIK